ncbi:hypothetical protein D3C86_1818580 [compost metagenome]
MQLRLAGGLDACLVEVLAILDQLGTQGTHGGIFLQGVALRHHDDDRQTNAARSQGQALAMVAARGRYQPAYTRQAFTQCLDIQQATADFEGTGRRMVFMLDPDLTPQPLGQAWPCILRGWRDVPTNMLGGFAQGGQIEHVGHLWGMGSTRS